MKRILKIDVNGTLFDDWSMARKGIHAVFAHHGVPCPPLPVCIREVCRDGDWVGLYERRGINVVGNRERLREIFARAFHAYTPKPELMPGVHEALMDLKRAGVELHIITAAHEALVQPLLRRYFPRDFFVGIHYSADDKASVMRGILHGRTDVCAFKIGDMPSDMRHARAVGVHALRFVNNDVPADVFEGVPHTPIRTFFELREFVLNH